MSQKWFGMMVAVVSNEVLLGDAFTTGLIVLVMVFATLCVLSFTIWLFGRSGNDREKTGEKKERPAPTPAAAPRPSAPVAAPVQAANDGEDDGAVAAAIAAAVAMLAPTGVTYRVKKITPAGRTARSAWAAAAIHQNTAPF